MTYEQGLDFWFKRINYEKTAPRASDLKLDRMRDLLRRLGNPHERLRIVHVAGSKGKGSTSAVLAAIMRQAGYRTGLFTSPHLCRVEERIQIDGEAISKEELTAVLADIQAVVEDVASPLAPTFFEVATAAGFLHFTRRAVDVAVCEVGLGGRFDSTNVCLPLVSVITSISFDHTEQLGNRLASIAMEKAGIVKPGCPAVSGATAPEAREVIEAICRERRAPLQQLHIDFRHRYEPGRVIPLGASYLLQKPRVRITTAGRVWPTMELGLLGQHQADNAAVAVACVEQVHELGLPVDDEAVRAGLAGVRWPARLEVFGGRPLVVLDCAHNLASVHALLDTLAASFPSTRRLLVFAGSSDKDVSGMLRLLTPHFAHIFLTRFRTNPRSLPPDVLGAMIERIDGPPFTTCPTPQDAWQAARACAGPADLICITGSVFLAGEVRPFLAGEEQPSGSRE
jgi:dihydrofolate synthase/folylpolyglutamate synthase